MTTDVAMALARGVDSFTRLDLFQKAAEYMGFELGQTDDNYVCSKPIQTYTLDDDLLAFLAKQGIKLQDRPDCNHTIYTLIDTNPQKEVPGWMPSRHWNFKSLEGKKFTFDLQISLSVKLELNMRERGIRLWPATHGTLVSPCDHLPNLRMFKALVSGSMKNNKYPTAPAVARKLAESDGHIVVSWTDLNLGGLRSLADLFIEFSNGNEKVRNLAVNQQVFVPLPYPRARLMNELFIAEPAQPKVMREWKKQLEEYRSQLAV